MMVISSKRFIYFKKCTSTFITRDIFVANLESARQMTTKIRLAGRRYGDCAIRLYEKDSVLQVNAYFGGKCNISGLWKPLHKPQLQYFCQNMKVHIEYIKLL
jgi:hypothetical protein